METKRTSRNLQKVQQLLTSETVFYVFADSPCSEAEICFLLGNTPVTSVTSVTLSRNNKLGTQFKGMRVKKTHLVKCDL